MQPVTPPAIVTDKIDLSLIVRFTRPEIRNPLSISVLTQLRSIVEGLDGDSLVERLVLTGTDGIFASGANLREIAAVTAETVREFSIRGQSLMTTIESMSQLTVAAVNGPCYGGALDLALACDRRIASRNATFAHPGTGLGIITGWGGTQRLPRLIGEAAALETFFTAEPIDADTALKFGLIERIADDVVAQALAFDPSRAI